ncbi:MAG: hypothetical protein Kow0090_08260 [Myxococcota bacterium]
MENPMRFPYEKKAFYIGGISVGLPLILALFFSCAVDILEFPTIDDPTMVKGRDCKFTSDCELGKVCENGHCITGCRKTADCQEGFVCAEGQCETPKNGELMPPDDDDHDADDDSGESNADAGEEDTLADAELTDDHNDFDDDDDNADASNDSGAKDDGGDDDTEVGDDGGGDDDGGDDRSCKGDGDCPLGFYCKEGACFTDCQSPNDCPSEHICDSSGRCKPTSGDAGEEDAGDDDAGGEERLDLVGYFGMKVEIHTDVQASWVSAANVVSYQYILFYVLKQSGTFIETASKYCKIELPKVNDTETTIRQEAIDNIPVAHEAGDYLSSGVFGATYTPPTRAEVMGAELADPYADPLPKRAEGLFSDKCPDGSKPKEVSFKGRKANICWAEKLRDTDVDSIPAITAHLTNVPFPISGDVDGYIDLKNILQLRGIALDNSTIVGDVMPNMKQETLAIDHWLQDVASVSPTIKVRQGENTFKMLRIDGRHNSPNLDKDSDGVVDCNEFMEQKEIIGF